LYIRLDRSLTGQYDRETLSIMHRHLKKQSNCIDVGAHRGAILTEILALSPAGKHFAFEPVPRHYQYLVKSFPAVHVFPQALSNVKTRTSFTHNIDRPTRSSLMQPTEDGDKTEIITVETDLLDNVIPPHLPIHFIKLDVEGAEFLVLQGSVHTIRKSRPLVLFEHNISACSYYGFTTEQMYDLLILECGLNIWPVRHWLERQPALDRAKFIDSVERGLFYFFVAGPNV
jgi:FkbM family methyltransferase